MNSGSRKLFECVYPSRHHSSRTIHRAKKSRRQCPSCTRFAQTNLRSRSVLEIKLENLQNKLNTLINFYTSESQIVWNLQQAFTPRCLLLSNQCFLDQYSFSTCVTHCERHDGPPEPPQHLTPPQRHESLSRQPHLRHPPPRKALKITRR